MSSQLPYPLPGQFDPSGPFRNPGATNPLPAPADMPTACWFGGGVPINWVNVSVANPDVALQYDWRSPIFDMRPDIRDVASNTVSEGFAGRMSGLPMWNSAAQLWVQLENPANAVGIQAVSLNGFQVLATEAVHISDPNRLRTIADPEDITAEFTTLGQSSVLGWYPFGDSNPARFYQLRLTFNMLKFFQNPEPLPGGGNPPPVITIVPAMY